MSVPRPSTIDKNYDACLTRGLYRMWADFEGEDLSGTTFTTNSNYFVFWMASLWQHALFCTLQLEEHGGSAGYWRSFELCHAQRRVETMLQNGHFHKEGCIMLSSTTESLSFKFVTKQRRPRPTSLLPFVFA